MEVPYPLSLGLFSGGLKLGNIKDDLTIFYKGQKGLFT